MWYIIISAILIVVFVLVYQKLKLVRRLKFLAAMRKSGKSAENFMAMGHVLDTNKVRSSPQSQPLPGSALGIELPETFTTEDKELSTAQFLKQTGCNGLLVLHNGKIVYEHYSQGMKPGIIQMSFSVTKSITSAAVGLAIRDGLIGNVEDDVVKYLPDLAGSGYDGVTVEQCLEMSSGTDFLEDYEQGKPSDMPKFQKHFALKKPFIDFIRQVGRHPDREAGKFNGYNSLDAQVAGMCVSAALKGKCLSQYFAEELWSKIGAEDDAKWLIDGKGMEMTAGGLCASLRDLGKFGQLYLQKGRWGDRQILPEEWVSYSTTPHAPHLMPGIRENSVKPWGYGYLWWTPEFRYGEDYFASGIYNNYVYVNPLKRMVISNLSANEQFMKRPESFKLNYLDLFQTIARSLD
ncbi:MAG: serine hydrolase [Gammaproteobacteria bacterium]|nr:serine hydrolase [Gammaproteobacteria bacterium]